MKDFNNKNILITGGASGIGKLMAQEFLKRGAHVIIWDIDNAKLEAVKIELSDKGKVFTYNLNIADQENIKAAYVAVMNEHKQVDVLINNAGIVLGKYFHEHSADEIRRTMEINAYAPMFISHLFLQDMLKVNSGYICNISSSAAMISNPKMSVYAASKWSVLGW